MGHLERFNPAVIALEQRATLPLFFEIHRMNLFSPRSLDVDVVLDLMIHDVDLVLALARAEPEEIRAAGISILSGKVDIANVRLQFPNGCVANLTASRISTERVRKLRLFQPHQYLSLDYAPPGSGHLQRQRRSPDRLRTGARYQGRTPQAPVRRLPGFAGHANLPKSSGAAARRTLAVALAILDKIKEHSEVVSRTSGRWMETVGRPPAEAEPELQFLTEWGDHKGPGLRREAGIVSIAVHAALFLP